MRALSHFWQTFVHSASEPDYYIWLLGTKFSSSLKFYLTLLLLLSLADVAIFRLREVPKLIEGVTQETTHALNSLPPTFSVVYSGGTLQYKGLKLPHTIKSTAAAKSLGLSETLITLHVTETPAKDSFVTVTPSALIIQGSSDLPLSTSAYPLKDLFGDTPISLDKTGLEAQSRQTLDSLPQAANILVALAIPIWFVGLALATTLTLLFLTLLSNSFAWILGIHMPFIKTLQLGLHAIGVATAIDVIKYALYPNSPVSLVIPGYLGIMSLVIWRLRTGIVEKR